MRDKATVVEELRAVVKEICLLADEMEDCGGIQGAAVLASHSELRKALEKLSKEAESLGITPEDLPRLPNG